MLVFEYEFSQAGDTRIPLPRKSLWTPQKIVDCKVGLYTSLRTVAEFEFLTKFCVSFTNSATVGRLEQVQLCNRLIDQSADNITGLKCAKECLIRTHISTSRMRIQGFWIILILQDKTLFNALEAGDIVC